MWYDFRFNDITVMAYKYMKIFMRIMLRRQLGIPIVFLCMCSVYAREIDYVYYNQKYGIEIKMLSDNIKIINKDAKKNRGVENNYKIKRVKGNIYKLIPSSYPVFIKQSDAKIYKFNNSQSEDSIRVYVYIPHYDENLRMKIHYGLNSYVDKCMTKIGIINMPKHITDFTIEIAPISYLPGTIENQYVGILYGSYNYPIKPCGNDVLVVFDTITPYYFYDIWINNEFVLIDDNYIIWRNFIFIKNPIKTD